MASVLDKKVPLMPFLCNALHYCFHIILKKKTEKNQTLAVLWYFKCKVKKKSKINMGAE